MSLAPAVLSAGIKVLTPFLGTTVSTAFISPLARAVIVGDDMNAVEAVVPKRGVNTLIPALKAAGARDILELPISKIVE